MKNGFTSPLGPEFIERRLADLAVSTHENNIFMAHIILITITPHFQFLPI